MNGVTLPVIFRRLLKALPLNKNNLHFEGRISGTRLAERKNAKLLLPKYQILLFRGCGGAQDDRCLQDRMLQKEINFVHQ